MSGTQNVIIQNAELKCIACINAIILLSYHAVGCVLTVDCSRKISRGFLIPQVQYLPTECKYELLIKTEFEIE